MHGPVVKRSRHSPLKAGSPVRIWAGSPNASNDVSYGASFFVIVIAMVTALDRFKEELYGANYDVASFRVSTMVGTSLKTASIPIPHVKEVVKAHAKDPELDLDSFPLEESVELTLCYFLLSLIKEGTFEKQMAFLQGKLRYANSWEITDSLQQVIKKAPQKSFLPFYERFVRSAWTYEKRFAYVYAMRYYRDQDIDIFLKKLRYDDEYYVGMAQAWMLATFGITHFEMIKTFLLTPSLPLFLKRKAISKMRDSYRITSEEKEILKQIRDNF